MDRVVKKIFLTLPQIFEFLQFSRLKVFVSFFLLVAWCKSIFGKKNHLGNRSRFSCDFLQRYNSLQHRQFFVDYVFNHAPILYVYCRLCFLPLWSFQIENGIALNISAKFSFLSFFSFLSAWKFCSPQILLHFRRLGLQTGLQLWNMK